MRVQIKASGKGTNKEMRVWKDESDR